MKLFPCGHATHPQWQVGVELVLAQLRAQLASPQWSESPTLGLLYITDRYADSAQEILDTLTAELPEVTDWSGTVGIGIAVNNAEYFDEPALAVLLCELGIDQYRVFSGVAPLGVGDGLGFEAHTALVHADSHTPDVTELIVELAGRTQTGYLFGGLASSRSSAVQFAIGGNGNIKGQGAATGVFSGGLSGVAFGADVNLISRVTQGCQPIENSPPRSVTSCDGNLILELDGQPALEYLLNDLGVSLNAPEEAIAAVRKTLVGINRGGGDAIRRTGNLGADTCVRHIIGLDPRRHGIAVAESVRVGEQLTFCQRNVPAARADLMRICAEIRDELDADDEVDVTPPFTDAARKVDFQSPISVGQQISAIYATDAVAGGKRKSKEILGALYVSCVGRGGSHFGAPGAEMQIVRHALGDVPLVGFFAGGEIARQQLYGYTGVLTVFTS